ncbi:hypothetical protein NSP62_23015, partial [Salmonella enterica]|nr:hypothetical protein [Salmonella enterica]
TMRASSSRKASRPRRGDGTANRQRQEGMATPEIEDIRGSLPVAGLLADEADRSIRDKRGLL